MFYLMYGIFNAVGFTIRFIYVAHCGISAYKWSLYCVMLLSIGIVGFVLYALVAWCYKNRQRPATDEAEVQRILMYANVYGATKY